jgi:hypothetical protein
MAMWLGFIFSGFSKEKLKKFLLRSYMFMFLIKMGVCIDNGFNLAIATNPQRF